MAKMSARVAKESSGGYERVFGNKELGNLITKVHVTSIANGAELEKILSTCVENKIDDLDHFLSTDTMPDGVFLATQSKIKLSQTFDTVRNEPDFLVFAQTNGGQNCYVIELKDGHVFDTKKAEAEYRNLKDFVAKNAGKIPFTFSVFVVGFNQNSKDAIVSGFKNKISKDEAMTGREFCKLLSIDYSEIINVRKADQNENIDYFINELMKIPTVRQKVLQAQRNK